MFNYKKKNNTLTVNVLIKVVEKKITTSAPDKIGRNWEIGIITHSPGSPHYYVGHYHLVSFFNPIHVMQLQR
jgi:hypothetical protein